MKIKIENEGMAANKTNIYLNGTRVSHCTRFNLSAEAGGVVTLDLNMLPSSILFEGDAAIYVVIDGKRYKLIEEPDESDI